jgi:hypothetical protein
MLHCSINLTILIACHCVNTCFSFVHCNIEEAEIKPGTIVIKKDGNDKCYDAPESPYVNPDSELWVKKDRELN